MPSDPGGITPKVGVDYCVEHAAPTGRVGNDLPPLDDNIHVSLSPKRPKRIVVGVTGGTGAVYAIRILAVLRQLSIETHLVIRKRAMCPSPSCEALPPDPIPQGTSRRLSHQARSSM